jgi:hypothetical protein
VSQTTTTPCTGDVYDFNSNSDCQRRDSPDMLRDFMCCQMFNARSLRNKLLELHGLLYGGTFDLLFVIESWLRPDDPDGLLDPKHVFDIFRKDRLDGRGGGICVFIRKEWNAQRIHFDQRFELLELMGIDVHVGIRNYRFLIMYRRPGYGNVAYNNIVDFTNALETLLNNKGPTFLLGDFNFPNPSYRLSS